MAPYFYPFFEVHNPGASSYVVGIICPPPLVRIGLSRFPNPGLDLNILHSQIVKNWICTTIKMFFWWQNFSDWKFKIPSFEFIQKTRRSKLPQFDVGTYTVECGVVDFVGEVECPSDVVVVSVGFAEVVGVGFLVVVLKVLKHTWILPVTRRTCFVSWYLF